MRKVENGKCPAIAPTGKEENVMAGREIEARKTGEYGRISDNSLFSFCCSTFEGV